MQITIGNQQLNKKLYKINNKKRKLYLKSLSEFSRISRVLAINSIHNFQDFFYINQQSIRDPERCEVSLLQMSSKFQLVSSVEFHNEALFINFKSTKNDSFSLQYVTKRFQSFGDKTFQYLAKFLKKLNEDMQKVTQKILKTPQFNPQAYLNSVIKQSQDKVYLLYNYSVLKQGFRLKSIILSQQLLKLLGYDYEELGIRFSRVQGIDFNVINPHIVSDCLLFQAQSIQYYWNQILRSDFDLSKLQSKKSLLLLSELKNCKNQILIVESKITMPNICVIKAELVRVIGIKQEYKKKKINSKLESDQKIKDKEFKTLQKLIKLPKNELKCNEKLVCQYRQKQ